MRVLGSKRYAHATTQQATARIDDSSSDIPALPADQEPHQDDVTDLEWMNHEYLKRRCWEGFWAVRWRGRTPCTTCNGSKGRYEENYPPYFSVVCTELVAGGSFQTLWRNISGEFLVISRTFFFVQNFQDDKINRDIRLFHWECWFLWDNR